MRDLSVQHGERSLPDVASRSLPLLEPSLRRLASSAFKFRNRFDPPESVQLTRLVQASDLLRDASTDYFRHSAKVEHSGRQ